MNHKTLFKMFDQIEDGDHAKDERRNYFSFFMFC